MQQNPRHPKQKLNSSPTQSNPSLDAEHMLSSNRHYPPSPYCCHHLRIKRYSSIRWALMCGIHGNLFLVSVVLSIEKVFAELARAYAGDDDRSY